MLLSFIMATDVGSTVQYVSAQYVFSHFVLAKHETWIYFYLKLKKEIYRMFNNWKNNLETPYGRGSLFKCIA